VRHGIWEPLSALFGRSLSPRRHGVAGCSRTANAARLPLFLALACALATAGCAHFRRPDSHVHFIAFGDSSTAGADTPAYPEILAELLHEPRRAMVNQGQPGESAPRGLRRLRGLLLRTMYPNAEVLLYWQGGQDITEFIRRHDPLLLYAMNEPDLRVAPDLARLLDSTQANVESAIEAGQSNGLRVYVATYYGLCKHLRRCPAMPFRFILPQQALAANWYIARLNERIRLAASNRGATLVDIAAHAETIDAEPDNYVNCNHLSVRGNRIVARIFFDAILRARLETSNVASESPPKSASGPPEGPRTAS